MKLFTRNVRTVLAVAALIMTARLATAGESPAPVCRKTTTIETRADGVTVIRTRTVCEIAATK